MSSCTVVVFTNDSYSRILLRNRVDKMMRKVISPQLIIPVTPCFCHVLSSLLSYCILLRLKHILTIIIIIIIGILWNINLCFSVHFGTWLWCSSWSCYIYFFDSFSLVLVNKSEDRSCIFYFLSSKHQTWTGHWENSLWPGKLKNAKLKGRIKKKTIPGSTLNCRPSACPTVLNLMVWSLSVITLKWSHMHTHQHSVCAWSAWGWAMWRKNGQHRSGKIVPLNAVKFHIINSLDWFYILKNLIMLQYVGKMCMHGNNLENVYTTIL